MRRSINFDVDVRLRRAEELNSTAFAVPGVRDRLPTTWRRPPFVRGSRIELLCAEAPRGYRPLSPPGDIPRVRTAAEEEGIEPSPGSHPGPRLSKPTPCLSVTPPRRAQPAEAGDAYVEDRLRRNIEIAGCHRLWPPSTTDRCFGCLDTPDASPASSCRREVRLGLVERLCAQREP